MKVATLLHTLLVMGFVVVGCAPDQPTATTACTSVSECPPAQVCERATASCIPEPADRFIGAFECTLRKQDLSDEARVELSEVIGHIGQDRWALAQVVCLIDDETDAFLVGLGKPGGPGNGAGFNLHLTAKEAKTGHVTLKLARDAGEGAAFMEHPAIGRLYGTSAGGSLDITGTIAPGGTIKGWLDIPMVPAVSGTALFGEPCPRGLADCGQSSSSVGGASLCSEILEKPKTAVCTRLCKASGECSVGDGACVGGFCTTACTTDRDCVAPAVCVEGEIGEGSGCF